MLLELTIMDVKRKIVKVRSEADNLAILSAKYSQGAVQYVIFIASALCLKTGLGCARNPDRNALLSHNSLWAEYQNEHKRQFYVCDEKRAKRFRSFRFGKKTHGPIHIYSVRDTKPYPAIRLFCRHDSKHPSPTVLLTLQRH